MSSRNISVKRVGLSASVPVFALFSQSLERIMGEGVHLTYRLYSRSNPSQLFLDIVSSPSPGVIFPRALRKSVSWRIKWALTPFGCTLDKTSHYRSGYFEVLPRFHKPEET